MKYFYSLLLLLVTAIVSHAQLLTTSPVLIKESDATIEIVMDANYGNQGLKDHTPTTDIYVHIGLITNLSNSSTDWKYSKFTWGTTTPQAQATYMSPNKWKYTVTGGLRSFFGVTNPAEVIQQVVILFRSGNGNKAQRNRDGSDMYIRVYGNDLAVKITQPFRQPTYVPTAEPFEVNVGDNIPLSGASTLPAALQLFYNGTEVANAAASTTISANVAVTAAGTQTVVVRATSGTTTVSDTLTFFVTPPTNVEPLPAGVKDGINYEPGDTSVILVLYAPGKTTASVIGDFNNWQSTVAHQMKKTPDGNRFWVRLTGLVPATEYGYQYLVDGQLKVGDIYAEKILDPWNDQYIPAATYPNLKPYPAGQQGVVSVLQTAKPGYNWQVQNFSRPDKRNLVIYELLLRDFVENRNWQTLRDTLGYLKRLGINTINILPFNEFEGNISWGYNPMYYFAPDKMYGTENALKQFIDECHSQGIAVVMDIALNHAFGLSPTVQLYWNAAQNRPAADNPWHNQNATHPFNVGFDFNHQSPATQYLVDRVIEYWLTNYKIDGFRWDLSKGFTQTNSCTTPGCDSGAEVNNWSNYDASRIATWKRIYDKMQAVSTNSYCILEHFAANNEEVELSNYGMLVWGNLNYNFNEATMGYINQSNFQWGLHTNRGWNQPHLITYQESHDEERLMYKNKEFGNQANAAHNVRNLQIGLQRNAMATAFWAMMPGPKMMWQFGEVGYDYSINHCGDGTINNNCRTDPKPIRWDYYQNPDRKALYDVYSKLFKLRNTSNFLPTWVTSDVSYNLNSGFKWMKVNSDSLKVTVVGNFDVVPASGSITFQNAGTWYNYLQGGARTATGAAETMTLQPGEFAVYINRNLDTTSVPDPPNPVVPTQLAVNIYPNPLHTQSQVVYELPADGVVSISLVNMMGQQQAILFNGHKLKGRHILMMNNNDFNIKKLGKGIYMLKLIANGQTRVKQFAVLH